MSARNFPWAAYWIGLAIIFVLANLPILVTIISAAVANGAGCTVSEAYATPCVINGTDYGYWLQFGGLAIFYLFITWPLAFVFFLAEPFLALRARFFAAFAFGGMGADQ